MKWGGIKKHLKTVPGKIAAAVLTAVVGAVIAYFAPQLLDTVTGRNGVKVSVEDNPAEIDTFNDLGQAFVVPRGRPIRGSPGAGCIGFADWGAGIGAVRAGRTDLRLVVQGVGDQIHIGGIRAHVTKRASPIAGTGVVCPSAGQKEIRDVQIDLDEPDPTGEVVAGAKRSNVSFTVGPNETEVFDITAWTTSCYCRWDLELVTTQDGEEKVVTVKDAGREFETTASGYDPRDGTASFEGPYYSWDYVNTWYLANVEEASPSFPVGGRPLPPLSTVSSSPG